MSFFQKLLDVVNPIKGINSIIKTATGGAATIVGAAAGGAFAPPTVPTPTYAPGASPGQPFFGGGVQLSGGTGGSWWKQYGLWLVAGLVIAVITLIVFVFFPFRGPKTVRASARVSSRNSSKSGSRSASKSTSKGPLKKGSPEAKARMAKLRAMQKRKR